MVYFVCMLVAVLVVSVSTQDQQSEIIRMDNVLNEDGSFQYGYETSDPITVDVQGGPKQIGEEVGIVMQGSYSYQTPEGQTITVTWVADENGFQPQGDGIPSPNA